MNESLETRLLKLAEVYKESENTQEEVQPIYRKILEYIREKKFDIKHSNSKNFITIETEVWKFLNKIYKPGHLYKKFHDVGDIFEAQERIIAPRIKDHIDIYMKLHNYNENTLKNMDSKEFKNVKHELYKTLRRVYIR